MVTPTTQKRLAEFAKHFQVEGHDDVFVLSSADLTLEKITSDLRDTSKNDLAEHSPLFNACLAVLATSAAILALHLIRRHHQERRKRGSAREAKHIVRNGENATNDISNPSSDRNQSHSNEMVSTTSDPPALVSERFAYNQPTSIVKRVVRKHDEQTFIYPFTNDQTLTIASPPRPLKTRVQEIVEISKTIDGLSESRALDVAVRLAQIESNETLKLTELAIHQRTSIREAGQKERHHREAMEEQGRERQWRQRLDLGFQGAMNALLSSASMLAITMTLSVLSDYLAAVWDGFKANPIAYMAGLVCEQPLVETTSFQSSRMWFVGTWAYDYMQATKTDLICGLSIAQYLTAAIAIVGVHSLFPGIVGKGIQHVSLGAILAKVSLRLLEVEKVLLGVCTVILFLFVFGSGVWCYHRHVKGYIGRLQRLPSIMEMDAIEDVYDQARIGFVICKVLVGVLFLGKAVYLAWSRTLDE